MALKPINKNMAKPMSMKKKRPSIPSEVKTRLWLASAGRCEFDSCNKPLWQHSLTMDRMNASYIAHIYAFSENGPRYDKVLSPKLEIAFENLMLVCDECHRSFDDKSRESEFPASRLIQMKKEHEERIELLTSIKPDKRSQVLLYGAKIGQHQSPLSFQDAFLAMVPNSYPSKHSGIEIGLKNSSFDDAESDYWIIEMENLKRQFSSKVETLKGNHEIQHFSIFGLAPQPLLIMLGTLLGDIYPANVFQLHREPRTWTWQEDATVTDFEVILPNKICSKAALVLSLSATVMDDRIFMALGEDVSIWKITIPTPHNDFLRSSSLLRKFRSTIRLIFDQIKAKHGQTTPLHVFPVMPNSASVEFGRVWMPKADMRMVIYDQNPSDKTFIPTITIG